MPRKKNSRRSAAQKQVMERRMSVKSGKGWDEGVSSPAGPSGPVPLADITVVPDQCLWSIYRPGHLRYRAANYQMGAKPVLPVCHTQI